MVSKFSWWDQLRATVIAFLLLHFEIEAVTVSSYNPCVACWEILPRCNLECCRVVGICILRVGTSAADSYTPLPLLLNHQKIPLLLFCCAVHPSHLPPLPGLESSEPTFMCCLETFCLPGWKEEAGPASYFYQHIRSFHQTTLVQIFSDSDNFYDILFWTRLKKKLSKWKSLIEKITVAIFSQFQLALKVTLVPHCLTPP